MSTGDSPERIFESITPRSKRKTLGQFFTPEPIADAMATWTQLVIGKRFLDPAVGTGILLSRLLDSDRELDLTGVELDQVALEFAEKRLPEKTTLVLGDYLSTVFEKKFDGIVANPPYIRHHDFTAPSWHFESGIFGPLSGMTNIYILFVAKIMSDLEEQGRAAILIPSDWTSANFALPFKVWLQNSGYLRRIVFFDTAGEVFHDNLSTGSLLLFEKTKKRNSLTEVVSVGQDLPHSLVSRLGDKEIALELRAQSTQVDLKSLEPKNKWMQILKSDASETPENYSEIQGFATSKRGIATGANEFFHLSTTSFQEQTPGAQYRKCVGRARDVKGIIFTTEDFENLENSDSPTRLLDLMESKDSKYIQKGEELGLPDRYLLKSRRIWYTLETRTPADVWVGVFSREGVKFIFNEAKVHNLTCFHGIFTGLSRIENKALVALMNSRKVQKINTRQQRSYGSGLNKLEPKDLLSLVVPNLAFLSDEVIQKLAESLDEADSAMKSNKSNWRDIIDRTVQLLDI
jgi:adenine-specific DNA-methyltransferase